MDIETLTDAKRNEWNSFCDQSDDAWFWHTTEWFDFVLNLNPLLESKQLSFFVRDNKGILAIVPLIMEKKKTRSKERKEFSFGGGPIPSLCLKQELNTREREKVRTFVFKEIDSLALQHNVDRASFKIDPLASSLKNSIYPEDNYLTQYGYIDTSIASRIIDLTIPVDALWDDLRRNHKRGIQKTDTFEITVYDKNNIHQAVFDDYKELHRLAAGRITRPEFTFNKMYQWILDGTAILVASKDGMHNKNIGFEYYGMYKNSVYGFSAANDKAYSQLPVRNRIEWEAMLWLKRHGYHLYEIGQQYYLSQLHHKPDQKLMNISHYKRGFGGFNVQMFLGEKYYSRDYFQEVMEDRIESYKEAWRWGN